jgi:integrase
MPGSLRKRPELGPDAWELRVFLGRDERGRVRHKSRTFRGSKRAAEKELGRLVLAQDSEPAVPVEPETLAWNQTTTVNDAIESWKQNGWADLSPVTVRRYDNVWKVHIEKTIGKRRLATLTPYEVERYFRKLKADGAGRETVRYVRSLLNRACRLARKWSNSTLPNPIAESELPSWGVDELPEPVRAPSAAEVQQLLAKARDFDPRFAACLRVVAATGARRGEVCALRWSNVDWENSTVTIDESIVASRGGAEVKSPKTRASIRVVAIDAGTLHVLEQLRNEQQRLASDSGTTLVPASFVFSAEPGGLVPPHPDAVSHSFTKVRVAAKLPKDLHLHSLRHFQATSLDAVIPERQMQARLGWSTVHMARHYTDVISSEDRKAAEHMGSLLDS